ncbi:hypothetical protein JW721_02270 [Candidatus Micrarchaeota archaeon]|nr:hypothetical protein [Candidatus Micrarchaeota archaeon]
MNPKQLKRIPKEQKIPKAKISQKLLTKEEAILRIARAVAPLARLAATTDPLGNVPTPEEIAEREYMKLKDADGKADAASVEERLSGLETQVLNVFSKRMLDCANHSLVSWISMDMLSLAEEPRAIELAAPHFEEACNITEAGILNRLESFSNVDNGFEHLGTRYGFTDAMLGLENELGSIDEFYNEYMDALRRISAGTGLSRENPDFVSRVEALQRRDPSKVVSAKMDEAANRLFEKELKELETLVELSSAQLAREEAFSEELGKYWPHNEPPNPREHADKLVEMSEACDAGMEALEAISRIREKVVSTAPHLMASNAFASLFGPIGENMCGIAPTRGRSENIFGLHKLSFPKYFKKQ